MTSPDEPTVDLPPPTRINRGCLLIAFLGIPILMVTLFGYRMFIVKEVTAEVLGHRWERRIDVETLRALSETTACDRVPTSAYSVTEEDGSTDPKQCSYKIDRWEVSDSEITSGEGLDPLPTWTEPPVDDCAELGCSRLGPRGERFFVDMLDSEGQRHDCRLLQADWRRLKLGMKRKGKKSIFLHTVACRSFLPPL